MNPSALQTSPTAGLQGVLGALAAGYLFLLLVYLVGLAISLYVGYRIIKAAVRNGVVEALEKTGATDTLGGATYVNGYPPVQIGAPPAPASQYGGYHR